MSERRTWNGFVCPDCRHVFRVLREHEGRGVVCPSCRRMLRLPEEGEETAPLTVRKEGPAKMLLDRSDREHQHRRRKNLLQEEVFDETFARKKDGGAGLQKALVGSLLAVALLLAAVLLWPDPDQAGEPLPVVMDGGDEGPESVELKPVAPPQEQVPEIVEIRFISEHLEPVVKRFLNAATLEEMAESVRHPELTIPRMERFYGDDFRAAGFVNIDPRVAAVRKGDSIPLMVEDREFRRSSLVMREDEEGWKVDWESWAGWSEAGWSEVKEERPVKSTRLRAKVRPIDYYNFSFDDEWKWSSYLLESADGEESLYGYAPAGGGLDVVLAASKEERGKAYLIEVTFPQDNPSPNQVVIETAIEGWVDFDE